MNIPVPSIPECLELIDHYKMLDNIRRHSFVVARVAETIVRHLTLPKDDTVKAPDMNLVLASALLHDIAKTPCLNGKCRHAEKGREICELHGYPEIGFIVGEHVILSTFTPDEYRHGNFPAREIVYYSDKRVKHESIVPLTERLNYIIERYSDGSSYIAQRIEENFQACLKLEKYIFTFLPFEPEDLSDYVDSKPFRAE